MKSLPRYSALLYLCASSLTAQGTHGVNAAAQRAKPYVILVSFDAFRGDYLDRIHLPNFERVMQRGVRSTGMIPAFPSKTFPNHYSIATGMYTETHGLVANWFWDPQRRGTYGMNDTLGTYRDGSWYRGEPIWVTAEKQGMVSASYYWPGSEANIEGVFPSIYKPFVQQVSNTARVDSVLAWLAVAEASRPHLITLYFADMDVAGHARGPTSFAVDSAAARVDTVLGRLLDGIERLPIRNEIYLILVSDHGMTETSPRWYAGLDTLIDMRGVRLAEGGPTANLHVVGGRARAVVLRDSINRRVLFGRAYLREDVPKRLHYDKDPRIGDLVVIMNEHWQIGMASRPPNHEGGSHGWDPALPSMHAIFVASGPEIPAGKIIPEFENIDVYPYIAELLGLTPAKGIDGKIGRLSALIAGRH